MFKTASKCSEMCAFVLRSLLQRDNGHSLRALIVDTYKAMRAFVGSFLKYGIYGNSILIDSSSVCQLKCLDCIQSSGEFGILERGFLKYEDFRRFVDDNPHFLTIEVSDRGEMFLNPELKDIVSYAYKKGVSLTAKNGVNLNTTTDYVLEHIVKYKFNAMSVSLDGASNEIYKIYRKNGNYDQVISNIRKINHYKNVYKSKYPRLYWQFVLFGHSEHEIPKAKRIARELGMNFDPKYNAMPMYSPIQDSAFVKKETGHVAVSSKDHEQAEEDICFLPCYQLWTSPQIGVDGKLLGCCFNSWGDYGNVFEISLKDCVSSERYTYAKRMLLGKVETRDDIPCVKCKHFTKMRSLKGFRRKHVLPNILKQLIPETLKAIYFEYRFKNSN